MIDFVKENINYKNYNNIIDFTNLNTISNDEIKKLCKIVEDEKMHSICILPEYVNIVKSFLKDTEIKIVATIDFPKGDSTTNNKIKKISEALINGANEIDVVVNYKSISEKDTEKITEEIRKLTEHTHREGRIIKIIIEIGSLNFQELEKICNICVECNTDYIMTSTGKLPNDNSFDEKLEKIKFIRKIIPNETKIKFSGGIRTTEQIQQLVEYVDRIGTSILPN